jgi:hypothetical protein
VPAAATATVRIPSFFTHREHPERSPLRKETHVNRLGVSARRNEAERTVALLTALPMQASAAPMKRGVSGCFAYSYSPGNISTTVYYHNRCKTGHYLEIAEPDPGSVVLCKKVGGGVKSHYKDARAIGISSVRQVSSC